MSDHTKAGIDADDQIRDATSDVIFKLSQMKFEDPNSSSEQEIQGRLDALSKEIEETFRRINE
jgi:V-type H+-transporting ATPase subunit A